MALEDDINALEKIKLLTAFDRDQLRLIAFGSHKLSFSRGYHLFHEGQKSDGGYLILSGLVGASVRSGSDQLPMGEYGPGSVIGELAMISQGDRGFTATVIENCELFKITQSTMQRILSEYPDLAADLHQRISEEFLAFTRSLALVQSKIPKD